MKAPSILTRPESTPGHQTHRIANSKLGIRRLDPNQSISKDDMPKKKKYLFTPISTNYIDRKENWKNYKPGQLKGNQIRTQNGEIRN